MRKTQFTARVESLPSRITPAVLSLTPALAPAPVVAVAAPTIVAVAPPTISPTGGQPTATSPSQAAVVASEGPASGQVATSPAPTATPPATPQEDATPIPPQIVPLAPGETPEPLPPGPEPPSTGVFPRQDPANNILPTDPPDTFILHYDGSGGKFIPSPLGPQPAPLPQDPILAPQTIYDEPIVQGSPQLGDLYLLDGTYVSSVQTVTFIQPPLEFNKAGEA